MKGQGLPINTIVLGALALLVLVLIAAAFIPSVGKFFKGMLGISKSVEADEATIQAFSQSCDQICEQMDGQYTAAQLPSVILSSSGWAGKTLKLYPADKCATLERCFYQGSNENGCEPGKGSFGQFAKSGYIERVAKKCTVTVNDACSQCVIEGTGEGEVKITCYGCSGSSVGTGTCTWTSPSNPNQWSC